MTDRKLVITVGTSLFSSAAWEAEGKLGDRTGYGDWLTTEYLGNPGLRRSRGWSTAGRIQELLEEDPHTLDDLFEWDVDRPERYSGELNTLIRLYDRELKDGEAMPDFLRRRYGTIDLVCSSRRDDPARIAAQHLNWVLRERLGHRDCNLSEVLRDEFLQKKTEQFATYLRELPSGPTDLLVTGGYKAFALLCGAMLIRHRADDWRLLYLHEEQQGELVIGEVDSDGRWRYRFASGSEVQMEGLCRPVGEAG